MSVVAKPLATAVTGASGRPDNLASLRALHEADGALVHELVDLCTEACLRDRFFGRVANPTELLVDQLTLAARVDAAVGAFAGQELVAMAVGVPDPAGATWEIGVLVRDDWQNRRIGAHLLQSLVVEASRAGVTPLAVIEAGNNRAFRLVHRLRRMPVGATLRIEIG